MNNSEYPVTSKIPFVSEINPEPGKFVLFRKNKTAMPNVT